MDWISIMVVDGEVVGLEVRSWIGKDKSEVYQPVLRVLERHQGADAGQVYADIVSIDLARDESPASRPRVGSRYRGLVSASAFGGANGARVVLRELFRFPAVAKA
jgi:hypothetical protein